MRASFITASALLCAALITGAGEQPGNPHSVQPGNPHAPAPQPGKDAKDAKGDQKQPEKKPIPAAKPEDVQSVDAIIKAFYASTAGNPGQPRDWDRFRSLFVAEARMIPVRHSAHGEGADLMTLPIDSYIDLNKNYFEKGGFLEKEVARRQEVFGSVAQVWSTFESRRTDKDPAPYTRGIYGLQLANNGERWFIINVMWDSEQEGVKLPDKYLKSPSTE
jgi:hypothetical protein